MTARMAFLALALATPLTSCASLAPSCDGSARRPLNRSLWDWENARPIAVAPLEAPAPAPLPPANGEPIIRKDEIDRAHATLPVFAIVASTQRCEGADHG